MARGIGIRTGRLGTWSRPAGSVTGAPVGWMSGLLAGLLLGSLLALVACGSSSSASTTFGQGTTATSAPTAGPGATAGPATTPPTSPSVTSTTLPAVSTTTSTAGSTTTGATGAVTTAAATAAGARLKFTLDQITPYLDTPAKVSEFMRNNIKLDPNYDSQQRGGNEYVPAGTVYERGIDDADGWAILMAYFLERNGLDAFMVGLDIETPTGINVCAVKNADGSLTVLEPGGTVTGPFASFAGLATFYTAKGWLEPGGSIRTLKASEVTQVTTDKTSPSVLDLPWVFIDYMADE
jgi:hypothetical protein